MTGRPFKLSAARRDGHIRWTDGEVESVREYLTNSGSSGTVQVTGGDDRTPVASFDHLSDLDHLSERGPIADLAGRPDVGHATQREGGVR